MSKVFPDKKEKEQHEQSTSWQKRVEMSSKTRSKKKLKHSSTKKKKRNRRQLSRLMARSNTDVRSSRNSAHRMRERLREIEMQAGSVTIFWYCVFCYLYAFVFAFSQFISALCVSLYFCSFVCLQYQATYPPEI